MQDQDHYLSHRKFRIGDKAELSVSCIINHAPKQFMPDSWIDSNISQEIKSDLDFELISPSYEPHVIPSERFDYLPESLNQYFNFIPHGTGRYRRTGRIKEEHYIWDVIGAPHK